MRSSRAVRSRRPGLPLISLGRAQLQADVLWLCVPDAAIAQVTRRLVQRVAARGLSLKGKIVVHSSGALSSEVLSPRLKPAPPWPRFIR